MYLKDLVRWLQSVPQEGAVVTYKEHMGRATLVVTQDGEEYESEEIEEYPVA